MVAGGKAGLLAKKAEMTARGGGYLRRKEYEYHSPVALINKKTKRVFAILSIALTNTPATQNQTPLSEQIAAKAIGEYERVMASTKGEEGGSMLKALYENLRYAFGLRITDTVGDLKGIFAKVVASLDKLDDSTLLIEAKGDGDAEVPEADKGKTLAELLGYVLANAESAADGAVKIVAAPAICDLLGVAADADVETISAKILEFKHPADMVTRAEYDTVVAKLAANDEATAKNEIDTIVAKGKEEGRITPSLESDVRAHYKACGGESTRKMIAKLAVQKPRPISGNDAAAGAAVAATTTTTAATPTKISFRGRETEVDAESLAIQAKVREIQREDPAKFSDYQVASAEYERRKKAAQL
jgi:hypothetical protein